MNEQNENEQNEQNDPQTTNPLLITITEDLQDHAFPPCAGFLVLRFTDCGEAGLEISVHSSLPPGESGEMLYAGARGLVSAMGACPESHIQLTARIMDQVFTQTQGVVPPAFE